MHISTSQTVSKADSRKKSLSCCTNLTFKDFPRNSLRHGALYVCLDTLYTTHLFFLGFPYMFDRTGLDIAQGNIFLSLSFLDRFLLICLLRASTFLKNKLIPHIWSAIKIFCHLNLKDFFHEFERFLHFFSKII